MPTLTSALAAAPAKIHPALNAERDRLIMEHLPQVKLIARRIHDRLPGTVSLDDLIGSGTVGLISAIDRYDATQGVKLKTYAEFKIRGAILDSLRDLDWAPRKERRRARALLQATIEVENRTQANATVEDVAEELGIPVSECHDWMRNSRSLSFETLDRTTSDEDGNTMSRQVAASDEDSSPSRQLEEREIRELLAQAIGRMPKQERIVLNLLFHEELSLREISRVMGLHESRISQIKVKALSRMRELMAKDWPSKGGAKPSSGRSN